VAGEYTPSALGPPPRSSDPTIIPSSTPHAYDNASYA
jgi:hypothetical protein